MTDLVAGRDDVVGEALALGADDQRPRRRAGHRLARARDERHARSGQRGHIVHARQRHLEDRPHRRAHGLRAERVGCVRADRDAGRAERARRTQDGPDVPRVLHAPQRDADRSGRLRPALLVDRKLARPGAERRHLRQHALLDVHARTQPHDRLPSRGVGRRDEVLALGDEAPAVATAVEPADVLQERVVM